MRSVLIILFISIFSAEMYSQKKVIIADFCVRLKIENCIDRCGDLIRLEGIISPIMQMEQRQ